MSDFSMFWCFSIKPAVSVRILRSVVMVVDARDSVDGCDSKTAPNSSLFSCPVGYVGDELAVVEHVSGCKITSSGAVRLVWTRVASFVSLTTLEADVLGVGWVGMVNFSTFWCFWVKSAIVNCVLRAAMMVDGVDEFETVANAVGDEKTVLHCKFSLIIALVVLIFVFFLFPESAGDCDVAMRVGELILRC
jgi:hypothetical protein